MNNSEGRRDELPKNEVVRDYKFYKEHPDEVTLEYTEEKLGFLNNFYLHFPVPEGYKTNYYRDNNERMGRYDKKPIEWMDEKKNREGYSDLYLNQTGKEFYDTLNEVVYQVAPNYDALFREAGKEVVKEDDKEEGKGTESLAVPRKLGHIYLEVYKRMRALGYNHRELTG